MNYITKTQVSVVALAMVVALSLVVVAPVAAHADDYGYTDTYSDVGSSADNCCDYGYTDSYSNDYGYTDSYPTDYGYTDTYGNDFGYTDTTDYGYTDTYPTDYGYTDTSANDYGYTDTLANTDYGYSDTLANTDYGYTDTYPNYSYDIPGNTYTDTTSYDYANDQYLNQSGYNYGSTYGSNYSQPYSQPYSQSYSQPYSSPSQPSYFPPAPRPTPAPYPTPVPQPYPSPVPVPQPQPTPVCPSGTTGQYPNCRYPQPTPTPVPQPQPIPYIPQPVPVQNTNINTNTCTNGSCNYIDNSINHSFNTVAAPLYQVTPQPIIQYQFTQPIQPIVYNQNVYCTITASPNSIQNGQATYLSWSSNGSSAMLSDGIGYVSANGSLAVRPDTNRTYTLTVYGLGGSNICSTTVYVSGNAPYVSLSQIPYTGFDFGPVGNAIYWMGLLSFAVAGAYLLVYYKGGAMVLAGTMLSNREAKNEHVALASDETVVEETPVHVEAPAVAFEALPVTNHQSMKDTMSITRGNDGTPRIVINRA